MSHSLQTQSNSKAVLFVICLAASLVPFSGSALNLALPYIIKDFSMGATEAGWVPTAYLLSTVIFQVPCARLADMVGRKKIFIFGVIIFLLFSVLSGLATSGWVLIAYRFLSGVGSAMVFGTNMAILTASVPKEKRGMALGVNTAVVYFSLAAGPLLGGVMTQYLGWQSIFYFAAAVSLIVVIGAVTLLKEEWKEEKRSSFDYIGSILYALCLSALIYGFSVLPQVSGFLLVAAGMLLLLLFGWYEQRQRIPVFNVKVFLENRVFKLSSLSALINYASTSAISFMLSLYLQYVRGLTPRDAGLILILQSLVQAVVSLRSGKLSDKMSPTILATSGMAVIFVGLVALCFVTESTPYPWIGLILLLLGFGFGIFSSPNMNVIMSSVSPQYYGLASATTGTMRQTGQAISMGIAMMAISLTVGNAQIAPDVHSELMTSMRITFLICSLLCLLGMYFSSVRGKEKKGAHAE